MLHVRSIAVLKGHSHAVSAFVEMPDGRIVTASLDTHLRVWYLAQSECVRLIEAHLSGAICLCQVSACHVASGSADKTIRLWNVDTGACDATLDLALSVRCEFTMLAMLSDGLLLSGDERGVLWQWELSPLEDGPPGSPALRARDPSSAGQRVGRPPVSRAEPSLDHTRAVLSLQELADPDGLHAKPQVLTAAWDGSVKLWNRCEPTVEDPQAAWWTIALTIRGKCPVVLDERKLVLASYADIAAQHSLWIWETEDSLWSEKHESAPVHTRTMKGHANVVNGIIGLDRGQILSYSEDATIRVWSARTLACKLILKDHRGSVTCVRQLQHGKYKGLLLSASWDTTLRLWSHPKYHT